MIAKKQPMNLLHPPKRRSLRPFLNRGSSQGFVVVRHVYLVMGLSMIGLAAVTVFFYVKTLRNSGASVDLTFRLVPLGVALVGFLLGIAWVRSALSLFRLGDFENPLEAIQWSARDSKSESESSESERVETEKPARDTYQCTACGARIQDASEVSPRGDIRCAYCNVWFNVHQP
jgi:DNA-directed RNA polymerase subunit RPC12/RpoP